MIFFELVRGDPPRRMAHVVTLPNGKCIVSWPTSTIVYDSEEAARRVHIDHMGGRGEPTFFRRVWAELAHQRGIEDCYQDRCEGVGARCTRDGAVDPPGYVPAHDRTAYSLGYESMLLELYGSGWRERCV